MGVEVPVEGRGAGDKVGEEGDAAGEGGEGGEGDGGEAGVVEGAGGGWRLARRELKWRSAGIGWESARARGTCELKGEKANLRSQRVGLETAGKLEGFKGADAAAEGLVAAGVNGIPGHEKRILIVLLGRRTL